MNIEQTYTPDISRSEILNTLKRSGALLLRNFVPFEEQKTVVSEVSKYKMTEVDETINDITQKFWYVEWRDKFPPSIAALGTRITSLVPSKVGWEVNQARAQLYSPGCKIDWHHDYKRDIHVIAVASFREPARFGIRLLDEEVTWDVSPGDLVLMRGPHLNESIDDRPEHRIVAPETGQRLSVAYRQVVEEVPELEPIS